MLFFSALLMIVVSYFSLDAMPSDATMKGPAEIIAADRKTVEPAAVTNIKTDMLDLLDKNRFTMDLSTVVNRLAKKYETKLLTETVIEWLQKEKKSVFDLHNNFTLLQDAAFNDESRAIDIFFDVAGREGNDDVIWKWVSHKELCVGRTALHLVVQVHIRDDSLRALIRNVHIRFGKDKVLEFINIKNDNGDSMMEWSDVPRVIKKILNELGIESSIS